MQINGIRSTKVDVAMPAWSPGVYSIRDFAGNVQQMEAVTRRNSRSGVNRSTSRHGASPRRKQTTCSCRYRVYSTAFTDEMADITPAAVLMYVVGQTQQPVSIRYETEGDWKVQSALERRGDRYTAPDYETLTSSPDIHR